MCRRLKDVDDLIALCNSIHTVTESDRRYGVPACEGNPGGHYCCSCKSFKHSGICSHVLAISHILKNFNIRYQLRRLKDTSKADKARGKQSKRLLQGNCTRVEPALKRMKNSARAQAAADESDEEEQRQLALGSAGL